MREPLIRGMLRMKIAIVGGDDISSDDSMPLCAALVAQGHQVTAYVRRRDRRRAVKGADQACQIVATTVGPKAPASDREVLPFVGDWAARLDRRWSADQPDIVHAYGWLGGLAAQLAARRRHLPTVQTFQGLAAVSRSGPVDERGRVESLLARNAAWVTGESAAAVATLAKWRHGRARMSILARGVDVDRYSPVGPALPHGELHRVLCLAPNPLLYNGFDTVIRALPRVPGAEVVIAETDVTESSHDEARAALKRLATELGVADRVRFMGTVVGDDVPMLLRSVDVVACTPRVPPRATTVLQAMASGVAVITLPVGVLDDVVVHGVTGLLVSPSDPAELAGALRSLHAQRFLRQSMGAAGRSRALSRFTWDRMALESLNIYQRLTSPGLQPAARQPVGAH
jgi:glycosyltransferase involved in cell wall biosynthesis